MALYRVPFDFLIFNPAGSGGELIEFDSSGDPQTIAAGTLGQILVADGAGSNAFQDPSTLTIDAADVTYDPAATLTPLVATDVQAAIDELEAIVNGLGFGDIDALPAAAIASGDVLAFSGASVGGTESRTTTAELATVMITEGVGQSFDIDALPAGTADDLADLMVISDQTDSGNEKSITLTDLQSLIGSGSLDIDSFPAGTADDPTDLIVFSDQSDTGTEKKVAISALASALALGSDDITNDSGVAGATVTAALDQLNTDVGALGSDDITNDSGVAGATVTAALDTLDTNAFSYTAGAIGSVCYASKGVAPATVLFGATVSGSILTVSSDDGAFPGAPPVLAGTWRCLGHADNSSPPSSQITLWVRIS